MMIKILGARRIAILLFLLLLNGVLAGGIYGYLVPQESKAARDLKTVKGAVTKLQTDIDTLRVEFEQMEKQQARFDALDKDSFFDVQGRRSAEKFFNALQARTRVVTANVAIKPGVVEENAEAAKIKYKILSSQIDIVLEALDDVDVYNYLYLVEKYFPGHVSMNTLEIQRNLDVNNTVLRGISSGSNLPIVKATMQLTWRTMIPENQVITKESN